VAHTLKVRTGLITLAGTLLLMAAIPTVGHAALEPFYSDSGLISLSVDAIGTNDPSGAPIKVHKNAGATVRKAFLFAATLPGPYTPVDGDVTLDGSPVAWDSANTISSSIGSINVESDVTALVKPKVDAAPAGDVSFTAAEPNQTFNFDGEILAVILDDPTVTQSSSVILLYGAQSTTGDTFHVALADPVDKTDPNFALDLSLGISFGYQPSGQFSTVDVNGTQMTSSAGGQDDCVEKYAPIPNYPFNCGNGTLITAGGIGDSNDNPPDPNAQPTTCVGAAGPAPRCDDELYNLLPFVNNGDTSLTFNTTNPSNDDNIFFGALNVRAGGAVVGKGVVLSPTSATNNVGQPHTLTATVQDDNGNPIQGESVHFEVTSGPNAGTSGDAVTDANGEAQFTYTSSTTGTDHIVASFTDSQGTHTSNEVTKTWEGGSPPPASLTLSPPTATNTVGQKHCVTATVKDSSGNPTPGISVVFTVSGANNRGPTVRTTNTNGVAMFCYTGRRAGTDTIKAFADTNGSGTDDGESEPDDTATKVYEAGPPATLTLSPKSASNPVDTQHCVTATNKDAYGNPTPGITDRFSVTGSVTKSGSRVTNTSGKATFCYIGPALPGSDVIKAYADTNNSNTQDAGEPSDTATKTWTLPTSVTPCDIKITNGGWIVTNAGDQGSFGGNATETTTGTDSGQVEYQDHGPAQPLNVHSLSVRAITCNPTLTSASIFGKATIDGSGSHWYRVDVEDLAEPGTGIDTYRIRLDTGYNSGKHKLKGGNIQMH
jgi:hypothetical protein